MSISALAFLALSIGGLLFGFIYHPIYALLSYIFIYFNIPNPSFHWWATEVPQFRWSLIAAIVLGIVCFFQRDKLSNLTIKDSRNAKWLVILLLLMIIISPFGVNPSRSFERVYDFFRYVVAFIFVIKCVSDLKKYEYIIYLYLLSCFHMSWIAWRFGRRVSGRLMGIGTPDAFDVNLIALLLLTSVPFIVSFILHGKKHQKIAGILIAPFVLNGIVLCSSRGAFIALITTIIVFFMLDKLPKIRWKVFWGCLGGLLLFIYLMDPVYIKRIMTLGQAKDTSISETEGGTRIIFWAAGLDMVKDYPFGAGGRGFQDLSPYYLADELLTKSGERIGRSSHNTYILVLVEQGPLGLAIFIGFIGSTFLLLHRARRKILTKYLSDKIVNKDKGHEHLFGQIVALESSIAGLLVGSIFVDRLYFEPLYWLCALAPVLYYFTDSNYSPQSTQSTQREF